MKLPSKERGCMGKINLGHKKYKESADKLSLKHGKRYGVYRCPVCEGTHITTKLYNKDKYTKLLYVTKEKRMKIERQVEALAKLDGIKIKWIAGIAFLSPDVCRIQAPDYRGSHDALQPIIDGLNLDEGKAYAFELNGGYYYDDLHEVYDTLKATPAQKREAILKAKGVWTDED